MQRTSSAYQQTAHPDHHPAGMNPFHNATPPATRSIHSKLEIKNLEIIHFNYTSPPGGTCAAGRGGLFLSLEKKTATKVSAAAALSLSAF